MSEKGRKQGRFHLDGEMGGNPMMLQIKRWLAPPMFPDDEPKTRRAILLNSALLTCMVLALCLIAGNLAGGKVPAVVTGLDIVSVALCLALRRWAYQGRVGLASGVLLAVGLVGITMAVAMLGTIRTPTTAVYILLVFFAGLLFDLGGMIAMTVLCSLAIAGLIVAENTGLLPRPDYAVTITQWVAYTVLFAWVGSFTLTSLHSTRRALVRANKEIVERKQAEEQLRYQAALLVNVNDAIVASDAQYRLTAWNAAAESLYGWKAEEVLRRNGLEITRTEWPAVDADEMRRTIAEAGHWRGEAMQARKDGTRIPVEMSSMVLRDESGQITGYVSVNRDITERKQAEVALAKSEARYRSLVETTGVGIATIDLAGNLVFVNQALCNMAGCTEEELLGKPFASFLHPDDVESVVQLFLNAFQDPDGRVELEFRAIQKDGHTIYCYSTPTILWHQGEIAGFNAIIQDITERKQAEEALRESEKKFRELIDGMNETVWVIDFNGNLIDVNKTSVEVLGYSKEELLTIGLYGIDSSLRKEDIIALANAMPLDKLQIFETAHTTKDGRTFPVEVYSSLVTYQGKRAILSIARDITERKRLEEILVKERQELKLILDTLPIIVFYKDREGRFIRVNKIFAEAQKMPVEDFVGKTVFDLYPPKIAQGMSDDDQEVFESGHAKLNIIEQYESASGIRRVQTDKFPICDKNGIPLGLIGFAQDITERKRAEEALQKSEAELKEAQRVGQIGSWDWNTATDMFIWSEEFNRIYGVDPRQPPFGYEEHLKAYTPESAERLVNAVMHSVQTGEGYELDLELACADGTRRWITTRGEVKRDANGQVVGLRGTAQDISERKRAEDALRESHARLAHLSRSLVEAQEQERRRIARELHDEVGQSLTALTISLDGVSRLALEGVVRCKIAEIQALTKHLIAEVNALSVELRPRVLDDLGLIPGLLSLFSRFSTQTGVEIDFKHTGIERKQVTPEIEISAYRIIQEALTNLVRHASVKTASVRLQVEEDIMYIQVQDEGKGFDLQKALNAEDSMGLLSMTERAGQIGGQLEIQTALGEGTLITCQLPLGGEYIERRRRERRENRPIR